jgi:uncharacterized protein (TIGR03437 family)
MTAGAASAQVISIVSGDGQVGTQILPPQNPLVVVVKNAQGQPVPGTPVTWTLNGQGSLPNGFTTTTDANGQSSNQFLGGALVNQSFSQTIITASAFGTSVNFTETTAAVDPTAANAPLVQASVLFPTLSDVLTGAAGSTGTQSIQVQVVSSGISGGVGIPNVLIRLIPADPNGPQIACSGNTGYTNSSGTTNCIPSFSGPTGNGRYNIDVGGSYRVFGPFNFTITQAGVSAFRITSGNNQSGAPGTTLPLPLTAQAIDANGNPLPNVPVTWQAVPVTPPGTTVALNPVTINNASTASDASGNVTANVALGSIPGPVQVRLSNSTGSVQVLFSLSINLQLSGISKVAGDNQSAVTNSTFAQPLIVQVNSSQGPAAGVQVQFTSTGAAVVLPNSGIATTGSNGQASITVQAGANAGPTTITASVSGFSTTFSLTINLPGPQITSSSFFNGVGGQAGGVSPASILAIYGAGVAPGIQGCVSSSQFGVGPMQILLAGVDVLFTEGAYQAYAPIYFVCNLGVGQEYVMVQVPADLPLGSASVTVAAPSGSKTVSGIPVTPVSPAVFETVMSDKVKRAVLQHADGSFVELENPAHRGEQLRAYVSGLGRPVSASGVRIGTNQGGIAGDDAAPQVPVIVGVADAGVVIDSVVYAPNMIGVYVVTFEVPADAPSGNNLDFAVAAVVNDAPVFGNPSKIPIQ